MRIFPVGNLSQKVTTLKRAEVTKKSVLKVIKSFKNKPTARNRNNQ